MWKISAFLLASIIVPIFDAYQVELFDGKNFDGWMYEGHPATFDCINFPEFWRLEGRASSLKTDVCIMVYDTKNCTREGQNSIKIPSGEYPDLSVFRHATVNFDNRIFSYRLCSDDRWFGGGDKLLVDLWQIYDQQMQFVRTDVCECETLPEYAFGNITRIFNFGNCVRLYSREGCDGDSVDIQGGESAESVNLNLVNFAGLTKSISACGDSSICTRFNAEVIQFELLGKPSVKDAYQHELDMGDKVTFRNNGRTTITEDYVARKSIKEVLEISRVKAMTGMTSVSISDTFRTYTSPDFTIIGKSTLVDGLTEAYSYTTNSSTIKSELFKKISEHVFSVSDHVDIPPCSEYTISSHVKMIQGYAVDYVLHAKIRGQKGRRKMTTTELKNELVGMDYVEDSDEHTIIAKANGTILADFGIEAVINGEGHSIPGCNDFRDTFP